MFFITGLIHFPFVSQTQHVILMSISMTVSHCKRRNRKRRTRSFSVSCRWWKLSSSATAKI